jgi:hypothetical protein
MLRPLRGPWWAEKSSFGYIVRDANGQILAYVPSRMTEADAIEAEVLTDGEARSIASVIVQLPALCRRPRPTEKRSPFRFSTVFGLFRTSP